MTDKIEVYWGDPLDGERHSVDFQPDDKIKAQAFATWLESTDGVIPDSVKVKIPEQRAASENALLGVACWPPVDPDYVPPIVGSILREHEVPDAKDGVIGEEQIIDGMMPNEQASDDIKRAMLDQARRAGLSPRPDAIAGAPSLLPPATWEWLEGVKILDPDGWRGTNGRPWDDPISREEWQERRNASTITELGGRG